MTETELKVIKWAEDKGINLFASSQGQILKVLEEMQEIYTADTEAERFDAIGDTKVTILILEAQLGWPSATIPMELSPEATHTPKDLLVALGGIASIVSRSKDGEFSEEDKTNLVRNLTTIDHVLEKVAQSLGTSVDDCLKIAYAEIADRRGLKVNGIFVKWADLTPEQQAEVERLEADA